MNEHYPQETSEKLEPRIEGVLTRVCGKTEAINPVFSLVDDAHRELIGEFYSHSIEGHILLFNANSIVDERHNQLMFHGDAPVFPSVRVEDKVMLVVPEGAKRVDAWANLFARDLHANDAVYVQIGENLRTLHNTGVGLPEENVLSSFAMAANSESKFGTTVYVLPPYEMNQQTSIEEVLNNVQQELEATGLSRSDAMYIKKGVAYGWSLSR